MGMSVWTMFLCFAFTLHLAHYPGGTDERVSILVTTGMDLRNGQGSPVAAILPPQHCGCLKSVPAVMCRVRHHFWESTKFRQSYWNTGLSSIPKTNVRFYGI